MKDDLTLDTEEMNGSTKQDDAVERIQPLMEAYARACGGDREITEETLTDFLADLMHWAKATGEDGDFDDALGSAEMHFSHETDDDDDATPEEMVAAWRAENKDDEANHNYVGRDSGAGPCVTCGDDEAGLLHAFDPYFHEGFHDDAIYEVVVQTQQEDRS